ncbi:MAG TPA: hypothetical protein O0X27_06300 [Methanocorpusculum sp.]|nr:hypothetical protein [Methanocorpusculum sp.]
MTHVSDTSISTSSEDLPAPLYRTTFPDELMRHADRDPEFSATMQEIADLFQVSRLTVCSWCSQHPDFAAVVTQVQEGRNDRMAQKLYRVASGYAYRERKTVHDMDGKMVKEEITEKYLPENVNAIRLWPINRNAKEWKARPEETVAASVTINLVNNLEEFR